MNRQQIFEDIKKNPSNHKHYDMNGLIACATINGAIDTSLMQAHEGLYGSNGGVKCDVGNGPCSCGAWH